MEIRLSGHKTYLKSMQVGWDVFYFEGIIHRLNLFLYQCLETVIFKRAILPILFVLMRPSSTEYDEVSEIFIGHSKKKTPLHAHLFLCLRFSLFLLFITMLLMMARIIISLFPTWILRSITTGALEKYHWFSERLIAGISLPDLSCGNICIYNTLLENKRLCPCCYRRGGIII